MPQPDGLALELMLLETSDAVAAQARFSPAAAALATWFSAAASEKDASQPIIPTPAAASTDSKYSIGSEENSEEESEEGLEEWKWPTWMSTALAALGGGLIAGAILVMVIRVGSERPPSVPVWEPNAALEQTTPDAPDGGVGKEALASIQDVPRVGVALYALGLPFPKKPAPGQKKPPCDPEYEIAALGACWFIAKKQPPCGSGAYEFEGLCVRAIYTAPSTPTSEDPR